MSDSAAQAEAAAKAAAAAVRAFNTELWTLYAFGVLVTVLRTYSRIKAVGLRDLRADDFIIWLAIALYTTQSTLAYFAVNHGQGLANNGMTEEQRAALSPSSREYELRVYGSKIQVVGWTSYVCLICTLKMALLVFYVRLTEGLGSRFRIRIWVGFFLVGGTFLASVVTIYTACRPLSKYWQIFPNPGNICQPAVASPIVWVTFVSSAITDIYLIMIPLPMLWGTSLKLVKKIASTFVLGAGVFVLVCSMLKTIFVEIDPIHGAQLAGEWGTREAFVSVVTTNLPMLFPLVKSWLTPLFGSLISSSHAPYKHPTGFRTIGGGDGTGGMTGGGSGVKSGIHSSHNRGRRTGREQSSSRTLTSLSLGESEERIVVDGDVKMQDLGGGGGAGVYVGPAKSSAASSVEGRRPPVGGGATTKGIVVSSEFQITEDRTSQAGEHNVQKVHEPW